MGLNSRPGKEILLSSETSREVLGPNQPPTEWVRTGLYLDVKLPGREFDHPPPSIAEVKSSWTYAPTPPIGLYVL
jgi:hypothetical protein